MEVISISGEYRIVVTPDPDAPSPRDRDWDLDTGAYTPENNSLFESVPPGHEFPSDIDRAHYALGPDGVVRWARIFHGITVEWHNDRGGLTYWWTPPEQLAGRINLRDGDQVLWPARIDEHNEMQFEQISVVDAERRIIAEERGIYTRWADGEVVIVTVEQLVDGEWTPIDSVGDNYLDAEYNAKRVAAQMTWERPELQALIRSQL